MKRKILKMSLIVAITAVLFSGLVSAQDVFEAPDSDLSGDTLSVELDSHESGWATLALPVNGEVPLEQVTDDCDLQNNVAYGYEGQGASTETINGMRGYAIQLENSCTAEIQTSSIDGNLAASLPDNGWTVLSAPAEMSVDELESNCSFNGHEGTNIFEITLEEGNVPLESSDTLEGTGLYWIRVTGNDCGLDLNGQPFETPGDEEDGSDDSSEDDSDDDDSEDGNPENMPDKPGIYPRIDYKEMDQHYVSPSGSEEADGTRDDPWSVDVAESNAEPGDVVNFLPGKYEGVDEISPPSGEQGNPVVFRSSERNEAKIDTWWAFKLEDRSYVHVQGFHVDASRTFRVKNSDHITIRDNFLDATGRTTQFSVKGSEQVKVLNNNMRHNGDHNGFIIFPVMGDGGFEDPEGSRSRHVLVAGNSFSRAGHQPAGSFANRNIAFRGNVFHNLIGRNFGMNGDRPALFEENLVVEAADSPSSASSRGKFTVQNGIFRFNVFHDNIDASVTTSPYAPWNSPSGPIRAYNNVFASQRQDTTGYILWDRAADPDEYALIEFENNIFDTSTSGDAQMVTRTDVHDKSEIDINDNLFDGEPAVKHSPEYVPYTLEEAESELSGLYYDNKQGEIKFIEPSEGDFRLQDDSPGINGGTTLTNTVNSGSGEEIEVEDSHYFHGGLGIEGLNGDKVRIGDEVARIEQVNWENDVITLEESIDWQEGEPVGVPWTGSEPDMGAMEGGESFAQIEVLGPERASVGENVVFEAKVNGDIDVKEICWQFGDGEGDCGTTVSNTYDSPYDYGVRVRVIDQSGSVYWGNHLLYVSNNSVKPYSSEYRDNQCNKFITEETGEEC